MNICVFITFFRRTFFFCMRNKLFSGYFTDKILEQFFCFYVFIPRTSIEKSHKTRISLFPLNFLQKSNINPNQFELALKTLAAIILGLILHHKFGLLPPYLLFLFCYGIYKIGFTKTRRKSGQRSAYSVFNPGCEKIQGEFSGETIDKQMRRGRM